MKGDIVEKDDSKEIPEIDYVVALIVGAMFVAGGILQIILGGWIQPGGNNGDIILGLLFLIPGAIGALYGVIKLIIRDVRDKKETKAMLEEKFGYLLAKKGK